MGALLPRQGQHWLLTVMTYEALLDSATLNKALRKVHDSVSRQHEIDKIMSIFLKTADTLATCAEVGRSCSATLPKLPTLLCNTMKPCWGELEFI